MIWILIWGGLSLATLWTRTYASLICFGIVWGVNAPQTHTWVLPTDWLVVDGLALIGSLGVWLHKREAASRVLAAILSVRILFHCYQLGSPLENLLYTQVCNGLFGLMLASIWSIYLAERYFSR